MWLYLDVVAIPCTGDVECLVDLDVPHRCRCMYLVSLAEPRRSCSTGKFFVFSVVLNINTLLLSIYSAIYVKMLPFRVVFFYWRKWQFRKTQNFAR
jgi:hypothetical protein